MKPFAPLAVLVLLGALLLPAAAGSRGAARPNVVVILADELYNLVVDRTETRDLAAAEPARLREVVAKWNAWAERTRVRPAPQPFRPRP